MPIDLTAPSRAALGLAALLARVTGEEAVLLHVAASRPPLRVLEELHALSNPFRAAGLKASLRTATGAPVEAIHAAASARRVRWVVMGTRGAGGADAPGSVAAALLGRCAMPVMAVRPGRGPHWLGAGAESPGDARVGAAAPKGDTPSATLREVLHLAAHGVGQVICPDLGPDFSAFPRKESEGTSAPLPSDLLFLDHARADRAPMLYRQLVRLPCAVVLTSPPAGA